MNDAIQFHSVTDSMKENSSESEPSESETPSKVANNVNQGINSI